MSQNFPPAKMLHHMILFHLANQGPMHGYGLATEIEKRGGWKPSQTSIYNTLKMLKAEGLVSPEEKIENGRAQIIYSLTELGKERYLQHKQRMQNASLHNIQQMMTILEGITEESLKKEITDIFSALRKIPPRIFAVLKVAPKKTLEILNGAIENINALAKEKKIDLSSLDKDSHDECD